MEKNNVTGAAQVAGGSYLGYKSIKHGLPRALGIRIEYHTTSKKNAELIKKSGNILNPEYGGKSGWSKIINSKHYMNNSKNFVHITGVNKKIEEDIMGMTPFFEKFKFLLAPYEAAYRACQTYLYKTFGNSVGRNEKNLKAVFEGNVKNKKEIAKTLINAVKDNIFHNQTKCFCIPGIDSYFNTKFIADGDDLALKTTQKLKVYNNRFEAMGGGIKQFGIKGIKENKSRAVIGSTVVISGVLLGAKLIKKGIENIKYPSQKKSQNTAV